VQQHTKAQKNSREENWRESSAHLQYENWGRRDVLPSLIKYMRKEEDKMCESFFSKVPIDQLDTTIKKAYELHNKIQETMFLYDELTKETPFLLMSLLYCENCDRRDTCTTKQTAFCTIQYLTKERFKRLLDGDEK